MSQLGAFLAGALFSLFTQQMLLFSMLPDDTRQPDCPPCTEASIFDPAIPPGRTIGSPRRAKEGRAWTAVAASDITFGGTLVGSTSPHAERQNDVYTSIHQRLEDEGGPVRLVIAINTIPRVDAGETGGFAVYLTKALESIDKELAGLPKEHSKLVRVFVLNMRPGNHAVFDAAVTRYSADHRFVFEEAEPVMENATAAAIHAASIEGTPSDEPGLSGPPVPGMRNRQQTRDVVQLSRRLLARAMATSSSSASHGRRWDPLEYVMYMEDDFIMCSGSFATIMSGLLAPGTLAPGWTAIRISYGLSGIIMRAEDVAAFADFIADQQFHRPVDILAYYWFGKGSSQRAEAALQRFGPERRNLNYRHNLLNHIGQVSTYPGRAARQFAECGDVLVVWSLHKNERFDLVTCTDFMLSPCEIDKLPASQELIAGEKVPHTAPWEVG